MCTTVKDGAGIEKWWNTQNVIHPLTVAIFDFDNFKNVNDTYGHLVGYYITDSAALIKQKIRHSDVLRWGGEGELPFCPIQMCIAPWSW